MAVSRVSMPAHFLNIEQKPPFCVRKSPRALCSDTFNKNVCCTIGWSGNIKFNAEFNVRIITKSILT